MCWIRFLLLQFESKKNHTVRKMSLLVFLALGISALAAPAPDASSKPTASPSIHERALSGPILNAAQLSSSLAALSAGPTSAFSSGYASLLSTIKPSPTPTNTADAASRLQAAHSAFPSDLYGAGAALLLSGMTGEQVFGDPIAVSATPQDFIKPSDLTRSNVGY